MSWIRPSRPRFIETESPSRHERCLPESGKVIPFSVASIVRPKGRRERGQNHGERVRYKGEGSAVALGARVGGRVLGGRWIRKC